MSASTYAYTFAASWFHWATAASAIGCIGTVLKAQQSPKEEKGAWMFRHKSLGLLTGMIVAPRIAYRLIARQKYNVRALEGGSAFEHMAARFTHVFLYGFMVTMPATGIAMGLYGGKGLPFFWTTLSGFEKNGDVAKQGFKIHKTLGTYGKFVVPVHAGAGVMHAMRGQPVFARINPFRTPRA
jgi:cytochrome b561